MHRHHNLPVPSFSGSVENGALVMRIGGRLDARGAADLWPEVRRFVDSKGVRSIQVDGAGIEYADGAGAALLVYIRQVATRLSVPVGFKDLPDAVAGMLSLYPEETLQAEEAASKRGGRGFVESVGASAWSGLTGLRDHIAFLGELSLGMLKAILHPRGLRARDFFRVAEAGGPQALPIIAMLGFLVGLILAFQGAVLMKQFGAEIYIADFVGKSVARELGPLITAIIVAGRTGSAFAAEIGTMKVNEEIDALTTMGLDPVRFLVIPRVSAATLMTPLLAVMTNLFGLLGGSMVMRALGFPFVTYINRVLAAVTPADYLGGLVKALVFGLLISGAGCLCGLRTGEGASAVGSSATRAVVSSIIMIVIADGVFAVLFYNLGI